MANLTRGRAVVISGALLASVWALASCGGAGPAATPQNTVNIAYAGSLVNLVEHHLAPAFQHATGYPSAGKGAGSTALANQIKSKLIQPDVFISASSSAYKPLQGDTNGNLVTWYMSFASTSMVIGYSPKSQYASQFQAAANSTTPWYQVLATPGLRLGRTDPALDPKGVNTLFTLQLAALYYHQPGLSQRILGANDNTAQIFPEEDLVARLGAGQLDAGFFYLNEIKDAGLPYIALPAQINLGDPADAAFYAKASYTTVAGTVQTGKPILYSVTILSTAKNPVGADAFVSYLLGPHGQALLSADGIQPIAVEFTGDAFKVPADLAQFTHG